ncbi:MAG: hypothetical protein PHF18_03725 [Methanosarcina sp.]|uniref:hypothetical protein n=1 Tax=Methanosarcina sp. TaxID=2213 RepID=UPI002638EF2A|nr:hypothetical protein [Methanosarcina sp.]MDD3245961.1 hypothetical protein [Methanosarcina sp.]MDD4247609.1 hypothetical protein [Methanosarcina sp.]
MQENSSLSSDVQYNPGRRTEFLLMGLLVILNIIIRIPSIPHEKGSDSFFIHSLANSISNFGVAQWWINWMSVFGMYPYSYASAVPFTLSGISQLTEIRMEIVILLFCVILGLFSIFTSYSLATVLYDNFLHRFLFTAIFSLSAGTLNLTTWEISTRAQILVFFPFLIYLVFQIVKLKVRFVLLFIATALLLLATHHFVYMGLFYSGLIFIIALIYKVNLRNKSLQIQKTQLWSINLSYIYILIVFLLILLIFLYGSKWGLITSGSRYAWIIDILMITGRNVGFILPLSVGGLIYYIFKKDKLIDEWAILICLLPTLIFSFNQIYGYLTTHFFLTLLGSVGLFNVIKNQKQNGKIVVAAVIIFLILNITFSTFFAHYRLGIGGGNDEWYMSEETYTTGEWIKESISWDKKVVSNSMQGERLFASYGGKPVLYLDDINNYMNGFIKLDENNIEQISVFSKSYYLDNPYVLKPGTTTSGSYNWICLHSINSENSQNFIGGNNISYFFGDMYVNNPLFSSLPQNKNSIYNSGRMQIWEN